MNTILKITACAVFFIAGCGAYKNMESWSVTEITKTLSDGRTVVCLVAGSGLSCDWFNAPLAPSTYPLQYEFDNYEQAKP